MPVLTSHVHSCDASTVGSVVSTLQLQPCLLVAMRIGIRARIFVYCGQLITYNLINIATINCWRSLLRKKFCHIRRNRYSLWTLHVFKVLQQQPYRMVSKGRKPSWKRDCMWIFKALCAPPPRMLHKREKSFAVFPRVANPLQLPSLNRNVQIHTFKFNQPQGVFAPCPSPPLLDWSSTSLLVPCLHRKWHTQT